jgi:hypothetical protein
VSAPISRSPAPSSRMSITRLARTRSTLSTASSPSDLQPAHL